MPAAAGFAYVVSVQAPTLPIDLLNRISGARVVLNPKRAVVGVRGVVLRSFTVVPV